MKLSTETIKILESFNSINSALVIKAGNVISTVNSSKTLLANAKVSETFSDTFGIYDLSIFLNHISLFDSPNIEIEDNRIIITDNGRSSVYYTADVDIIPHPPKDELELPEVNLELDISADVLSLIKKAYAKTGLPSLKIFSRDGNLYATLVNTMASSSNTFEINLDQTTDYETEVIINFDNLKLISGAYNVKIYVSDVNSITEWNHENKINRYWIAIQSGHVK